MTHAHIATSLAGERLWLGMQLLIEAMRRARSIDCPALWLGIAAAVDASYSLDAPCTLPAGGCRSYEFDADDMSAIVEQIVCEREAPHA